MIRIFAIVAAIFGLITTAAQAETCNHLGRYNFSGNGEHPMSLGPKAGTTCEATFESISSELDLLLQTIVSCLCTRSWTHQTSRGWILHLYGSSDRRV